MKAPDKIYTDNRGVYAELPIFSQTDANVEYIRKDALLEWANKELKDNVGQYHNDYDLALSSLIDKLNAM